MGALHEPRDMRQEAGHGSEDTWWHGSQHREGTDSRKQAMGLGTHGGMGARPTKGQTITWLKEEVLSGRVGYLYPSSCRTADGVSC
jgi:hypothetical protein